MPDTNQLPEPTIVTLCFLDALPRVAMFLRRYLKVLEEMIGEGHVLAE